MAMMAGPAVKRFFTFSPENFILGHGISSFCKRSRFRDLNYHFVLHVAQKSSKHPNYNRFPKGVHGRAISQNSIEGNQVAE